ncbi:MAG: hypothetical protein HZA35_00625 [Parcubacteria group bacterium]|nr:hypothetical protein [Parcubacteria group bacterium]
MAKRKLVRHDATGESPWRFTFSKRKIDIKTGEREFRKDFLRTLAEQQSTLWKDILAQQSEEVAQLITQELQSRKNAVTSTSEFSGPVPAGTRFKWKVQNGNKLCEVFCIENPPQTRTIHIFGEKRNLAFPWIYFLILSRNGVMKMSWVFYSNKSLRNEKDTLAFPNLPNIHGSDPYEMCLGSECPTICTTHNNWYQTFHDWFWHSKFINDNNAWMTHYTNATNTIYKVRDCEAWEQLSLTDPTQVIQLGWLPLHMSLQQFVETMVPRYGELGTIENKDKQEVLKKLKKLDESLITKFKEILEEKMLFLGTHLAVPVHVAKISKEQISILFSSLKNHLMATLQQRYKLMGTMVTADFITSTQYRKEESQ